MASAISIRAGSTLTFLCVKKDSTGAEESVAATAIEATFRETASNQLVATGTVNKTGGGTFSIGLSAATTASIGQRGLSCTN